MPWAHQTTGTPAFTSDLSAGLSVGAASGIVAGDVLLLPMFQRPDAVANSINTPSGYSLIATEQAFGLDMCRLYGKIATGGEGSVSVDSTVAVRAGGVMLRYSGGTLNVHAGPSPQNNGDQADIDTAALTVTEDNTLILVLGRFSWYHDPTVSSWPGSATGRVASADSTGQIAIFVGELIQTTAGNISAGSINRSDANTASGRSMLISLSAAALSNLTTVVTSPQLVRRKKWRFG